MKIYFYVLYILSMIKEEESGFLSGDTLLAEFQRISSMNPKNLSNTGNQAIDQKGVALSLYNILSFMEKSNLIFQNTNEDSQTITFSLMKKGTDIVNDPFIINLVRKVTLQQAAPIGLIGFGLKILFLIENNPYVYDENSLYEYFDNEVKNNVRLYFLHTTLNKEMLDQSENYSVEQEIKDQISSACNYFAISTFLLEKNEEGFFKIPDRLTQRWRSIQKIQEVKEILLFDTELLPMETIISMDSVTNDTRERVAKKPRIQNTLENSPVSAAISLTSTNFNPITNTQTVSVGFHSNQTSVQPFSGLDISSLIMHPSILPMQSTKPIEEITTEKWDHRILEAIYNNRHHFATILSFIYNNYYLQEDQAGISQYQFIQTWQDFVRERCQVLARVKYLKKYDTYNNSKFPYIQLMEGGKEFIEEKLHLSSLLQEQLLPLQQQQAPEEQQPEQQQAPEQQQEKLLISLLSPPLPSSQPSPPQPLSLPSSPQQVFSLPEVIPLVAPLPPTDPDFSQNQTLCPEVEAFFGNTDLSLLTTAYKFSDLIEGKTQTSSSSRLFHKKISESVIAWCDNGLRELEECKVTEITCKK